MAYKVVIKTLAEKDISEAAEYYFKKTPHLVSEYLEVVNNAIELIQQNPQHFQKRYKEVRVIFLKSFPFGLYYTIEDTTIFVHAVLHTRRDPKAELKGFRISHFSTSKFL